MVIESTAPPCRSANSAMSEPPPAKLTRRAARARTAFLPTGALAGRGARTVLITIVLVPSSMASLSSAPRQHRRQRAPQDRQVERQAHVAGVAAVVVDALRVARVGPPVHLPEAR